MVSSLTLKSSNVSSHGSPPVSQLYLPNLLTLCLQILWPHWLTMDMVLHVGVRNCELPVEPGWLQGRSPSQAIPGPRWPRSLVATLHSHLLWPPVLLSTCSSLVETEWVSPMSSCSLLSWAELCNDNDQYPFQRPQVLPVSTCCFCPLDFSSPIRPSPVSAQTSNQRK